MIVFSLQFASPSCWCILLFDYGTLLLLLLLLLLQLLLLVFCLFLFSLCFIYLRSSPSVTFCRAVEMLTGVALLLSLLLYLSSNSVQDCTDDADGPCWSYCMSAAGRSQAGSAQLRYISRSHLSRQYQTYCTQETQDMWRERFSLT